MIADDPSQWRRDDHEPTPPALPTRPQDPEGGTYGIDEAVWVAAKRTDAEGAAARKVIADTINVWNRTHGIGGTVFWMKARDKWLDRGQRGGSS